MCVSTTSREVSSSSRMERASSRAERWVSGRVGAESVVVIVRILRARRKGRVSPAPMRSWTAKQTFSRKELDMKKPNLPRPSAAMIVAVIALFVACAGSATAASLITGKQIQNRTIAGLDVKKRTLTTTNFSAKTLKSLRGKAGPAGRNGTNGLNGTNGANDKDGVDDLVSLVYKEGPRVPVPDSQFDTQTLVCDAG